MTQLQVGTRISGGPYNEGIGIVTRYEPGSAGCFMISRGMQPVSGYVDIQWPTHESKHIPANIVTSLPYRVHADRLATAEELAAVRAAAALHAAQEKAKADEAAAARIVERDRLLAEYPHLLRPSEKESSLTCAAKNIRTMLKAAFPGIKFAVRTSRFSGGNSIDIGWTDGPTSSAVQAITNMFQDGYFDGMTDCYEYGHSVWCNLFGSGKYVHTQRTHSPAALLTVCRKILADSQVPASDWTAEQMAAEYDSGKLYGNDEWLRREISEALGYK